MGRMLGSHGSEELDRPDLNKCPDCGCFFSSDNCPLCGKPCPEEMRAGNKVRIVYGRTDYGYGGFARKVTQYRDASGNLII